MSSSLTTGNPLELKKGQLYLIFDPRLRGVGHNCELAAHPFKRHPLNPVLRSNLPWERGGWWMCGTVLWDQENQHFKMWYFGGGPPNWERFICYAQSADGIHWEKPPLGIYDVKGSLDNNICFIGIYTPVIYHDKTATDSNKRYVMWGMQTGMDQMALRRIAARIGFTRRMGFIGNVTLLGLPYQLVGKIIGSLRILMNLNEN